MELLDWFAHMDCFYFVFPEEEEETNARESHATETQVWTRDGVRKEEPVS